MISFPFRAGNRWKIGFLIWGAGAIGGVVGAYLARAGHDVTLVDFKCRPRRCRQTQRLAQSSVRSISLWSMSRPLVPEQLAGTWPVVASWR